MRPLHPALRAGLIVLCLLSSFATRADPSGTASVLDTLASPRLVDQDGRPASTLGFDGRLVLLNFVFTGCGATCPVQTHELALLQAALPPALRSQVRFVSVSVDPLNDTPAALKRFALAQGADLARWSFVTGDPDTVARLASRMDAFARPGSSPDPASHASDLRLFDRQGRLVQRYAGVPLDRDRLVRELQAVAQSPLAGDRR